jgi:excinuclease ABC subunit B
MAIKFDLVSEYAPAGDQPKAIREILDGFAAAKPMQVLLGATGTGKTFTASNVIAALNKPTLVLAHNKTLAAQLYKEFKNFFPHNAVSYFISYYDYYQPEAYIPQRDIYIEKDASINENIDRLRLAATSSLVSREDVIVVASVSCIYGLGSPLEYKRMVVRLAKGETIDRDELLTKLIDIQYQRNDIAFERGKVRVRGDTVEIWPSSEELAYRVELFGDEVDGLSVINPVSGEVIKELEEFYVYPAKHFVTSEEKVRVAMKGIEEELKVRLEQFKQEGKLLEAERLKQRTRYDLDMMAEVGYCSGIENYSRWFTGRKPGEPPYTLLDFFPDDFLLVVDESHVSLPQVRGMYFGDQMRKQTLVEHGFRLPSAMDNRPLRFEEFVEKVNQVIFLSATPGPWEIQGSTQVVEQVIRPTGLIDPEVLVRPTKGQIDDLVAEIKTRSERDQRVLVTTLTKKMSEDLTDYLLELGIRVRYLHSEIDTLERIEILRSLRLGEFDVLVGINLLREGLDLPEVSLVSILDADKEGFLRSETSLIQTIGRAARNVDGQVIMYADQITDSMRKAISETQRRRKLQIEYNLEHGIDPQTIRKKVSDILEMLRGSEVDDGKAKRGRNGRSKPRTSRSMVAELAELPSDELGRLILTLEEEMHEASKDLRFEEAARLRDEVHDLKRELREVV